MRLLRGRNPAIVTAVLLSACGGGGQVVDPIDPPQGTGAVSVSVTGLPEGAAAKVTLVDAVGSRTPVAGSVTLKSLVPGAYFLLAEAVSVGAEAYGATPVTQSLAVKAGATATGSVTYALTTGRLLVTVTGLPGGTPASVRVTGPGGYNRTLAATETLVGLTPGAYSIAADPSVTPAAVYSPSQPSLDVVVAASLTPAEATVQYALITGSLTINVTGLPAGDNAAITVSGPSGYTRSVTGTMTLGALAAGTYTVAATGVASGSVVYGPSPASQTVTVAVGTTPSVATVAYSVSTGNLTVNVSGLPAGVKAAVAVTGPGGFSQQLTATTSLTGLAAGTYTIASANVTAAGKAYAATPAATTATIVAGGATASVNIAYAQVFGTLSVSITGLPAGNNAAVTVTGPAGFSQTATASKTFSGLGAGTYTVTAAAVTVGAQQYTPTPATKNVTVVAGSTASTSVAYSAASPTQGTLALTVSGLPGGVNAAVTVTGPGSFNQSATGSQSFAGLTPGAYVVTASSVSSGAQGYNPSPATQNVSVTAGATATATVTYSAGGSGPNLFIDGAYLTQAVQSYGDTLPLVAGRAAYLRVFVRASQANTVAPEVRARFYLGGALQQTITIPAPGTGVPTTVSENPLNSSWNAAIPASLMQPGMSMLLDVDPTNSVAESNETDNQFPATGTPKAIKAQAVPAFTIKLVPVLQSATGLQGDVTSGNQAQYLDMLQKVYPIGSTALSLRAAYTTTAPALESSNSNGAWGTVLNEILALRTADGASGYYYGVVGTTYAGGVAGIGFIPGSPSSSYKAAVGWDKSGSRANVLAHELGHNFGRAHSPCGGAGSPDPMYPYAGGVINVYGLDLSSLTLKTPAATDIMGYCSNAWVSDWTWSHVMAWRNVPGSAPPIPSGSSQSLLIWGRRTPGGLVLEPAFLLDLPATPTPANGAYQVRGYDAAGSQLFSAAFDVAEVADLPGGVEEQFAIRVPVSATTIQRLSQLRVSAPGQMAQRSSAALGTAEPSYSARSLGDGTVQLTWNPGQAPMVLVRDPDTGEVLSFARGGSARVVTRARRLELNWSDGVKSVSRKVEMK